MANQQYASAAELCNQEGLSNHSLAVGRSRADVAVDGTDANMASFGLDEDIAHLIRRAHQRASATFMSLLATHNLTPAQYFALSRLREKGEVSQNLLGRMSAMDPATIQGVVKRLGDRGLVVRVPDPTDRRRMILSLTEQGLDLIDSLRSGIDELSGKILAPLNDAEQDQLRVLLKRIV
jgi:DNA-binding MarR family transcriptional regulator